MLLKESTFYSSCDNRVFSKDWKQSTNFSQELHHYLKVLRDYILEIFIREGKTSQDNKNSYTHAKMVLRAGFLILNYVFMSKSLRY